MCLHTHTHLEDTHIGEYIYIYQVGYIYIHFLCLYLYIVYIVYLCVYGKCPKEII